MNSSSPTVPIGYFEVQRGWVDDDSAASTRLYTEALEDIIASTKRDYPDLIVYGSRVEHTRDGAGVPHTNLYVSFVPKKHRAPPLDPHNLNDAPVAKIGSLPDNVLPLGLKERKF